MKQKINILVTTTFIFFFSFLNKASAETTIKSPISEAWKDFPSIVNSFSRWITPIAIVGLIFIFVYGGYTKLSAAGDPEKDKKAMQILKAGVVGFILIVLAPFFVSILGAILGADLLNTST